MSMALLLKKFCNVHRADSAATFHNATAMVHHNFIEDFDEATGTKGESGLGLIGADERGKDLHSKGIMGRSAQAIETQEFI